MDYRRRRSRHARHDRTVRPPAALGAGRQLANLCLPVRPGRGVRSVSGVGRLIVKRAKARTPLIATAVVAVIGLFWFLSIPKLGNTGFQKFAEPKQRESAKAK